MNNITERVCFRCKANKTISEFHKSSTRYYQRECKECNRERKYSWHQTASGKISSANTKLKRRFGIDITQYNSMLETQEGKCLICKCKKSYLGHKLAVDHDHKTGKIRGLLCKACNIGIGNFKDSPHLLRAAANYLER